MKELPHCATYRLLYLLSPHNVLHLPSNNYLQEENTQQVYTWSPVGG